MLGLRGWGGVDQKHKCMYRGKGKARGGGGAGSLKSQNLSIHTLWMTPYGKWLTVKGSTIIN